MIDRFGREGGHRFGCEILKRTKDPAIKICLLHSHRETEENADPTSLRGIACFFSIDLNLALIFMDSLLYWKDLNWRVWSSNFSIANWTCSRAYECCWALQFSVFFLPLKRHEDSTTSWDMSMFCPCVVFIVWECVRIHENTAVFFNDTSMAFIAFQTFGHCCGNTLWDWWLDWYKDSITISNT